MTKHDNDEMTGAELGEMLLAAVRQMKAGEVGRVTQVTVPTAVDARARLGMSQREFAAMLGVSVRTLQEWEQGRREPSGAARTLLKVAACEPRAVLNALRAA